MNNIPKLSRSSTAKALNMLVKMALFVSFFIAIVFSPDVVEGKGMIFRAPLFMGSAILIPVIFYFKNGITFSHKKYPHLADALIAAPFLFDTLGNLLGIYDSYVRTDDVLHFLNWLLLIPGIMAFVFAARKNSKDFVLIGAGISAMAIIGWEVFEWFISDAGPFAGQTPDALSLSYGDTIGDLVISFSGGVIGVVIARALYFKHR